MKTREQILKQIGNIELLMNDYKDSESYAVWSENFAEASALRQSIESLNSQMYLLKWVLKDD